MKTKFILMLLLLGYYKCATGRSVYTVHVQHHKRESAYAGSRQALNIFALHRTQWVGLDGAPVTNTASINTPIKDTKLGLECR
jgi:hypothetical protein